MRYAFASEIIAEVAPEMGIRIELEPEFGFAGEMIFPDGRRHLFRNTNFNINPSGSVEIAKDKAYCHYILNKRGMRTPKWQTFFSPLLNRNLAPDKRRSTEEAVAYAQRVGFPLFAKPNNLSQGALVTKVSNAQELRDIAQRIFERTTVMLVESVCPGRDYRVVVLGGKIISAYERIPLQVTGDGISTIDQLLDGAKQNLSTAGRPNAEIDPLDYRIDMTLAAKSLTRDSVVPAGKVLRLLDNANLSTGGTSVEVTHLVHPSYAEIAVRAADLLGLKLAGVDLMCDDISGDAAQQEWAVLEMNAAPGLDNYASLGEVQAERVRDLYRQILRFLAEE